MNSKLENVVAELEKHESLLSLEDAILFQAPGAILPDRESLKNLIFIFGNKNRSFEVVSTICGLPGFCVPDAYEACSNTSLINCDECGIIRAAVFLFFTLLTGLMIIIGNLMVTAVSIRRYQKHKLDKMDVCKASLSIADFIVGKYT